MSKPVKKKPSPLLKALRKLRPAIGLPAFDPHIKRNAYIWFKPKVRIKRFPYLNMYPQRWPKRLSLFHFARYARRHPSRMTLFELAHSLPYRGVGCVFGRNDARDARRIPHSVTPFAQNPFDNVLFELEKAQFTVRNVV